MNAENQARAASLMAAGYRKGFRLCSPANVATCIEMRKFLVINGKLTLGSDVDVCELLRAIESGDVFEAIIRKDRP